MGGRVQIIACTRHGFAQSVLKLVSWFLIEDYSVIFNVGKGYAGTPQSRNIAAGGFE